jgi:hypothetical protein
MFHQEHSLIKQTRIFHELTQSGIINQEHLSINQINPEKGMKHRRERLQINQSERQ